MAYPNYGPPGFGRGGYAPVGNYRYDPYQSSRGSRGRGRGGGRGWHTPVHHRNRPSLDEVNDEIDVPKPAPQPLRTIKVDDIQFSISPEGTTLTRITPLTEGAATPQKTEIAGIIFIGTMKGNHMYRQDKYAEIVAKKAQRPPPPPPKLKELCAKFNTTGSCRRDCRYTHDVNKLALCKTFLLTGHCNSRDCQLSHEPNPNRSPACQYFSRGRCTNPDCRYTHVNTDADANVCRDFALLGYCDSGASCIDRHIAECPDYANTGSCKRKECRLPHVDRAGQLRKIAGVSNVSSPPSIGSPTSNDGKSNKGDEDGNLDSDDSEEGDTGLPFRIASDPTPSSLSFPVSSLLKQQDDSQSSFSKQEDYIRL
ncbi:hypothetical protein EJ08DRAFT_100060 [Tothia fuscella]|uniref:C3H1-type domain-containing protein n=1 Tax=Tothia fuscella TaxID=1048955 RepID=A0A9P4U1F6_9PEZI|nr:hypothetical protein EJ08DRAFT_100060 [Tothia fuscella]